MNHKHPLVAPQSPYRASYRPESASHIDAQDNLRTLRDWVRYGVSRLHAAGAAFGHGTGNAYDEIIWLVCWCVHLPVEHYDDLADTVLLPDERRRLRNLIDARSQCDKPLAYIIGEAWLMGFRFRSDARALVPRSLLAEALVNDSFAPWLDPEILAPFHDITDALDAGLARAPEAPPVRPHRILDLCTGGGSIAIIAAHCFPDAEVVASDISADALALAAENINDYGLEDRISLRQGDLFEHLEDEQFKLILCNPPYVNAGSMSALPAEFRAEPEGALAGGYDGMDLIERLLREAGRHLWKCGVLVIEIGHEMPNFQARFADLNWTAIPVAQGDDRVVLITASNLALWRQSRA